MSFKALLRCQFGLLGTAMSPGWRRMFSGNYNRLGLVRKKQTISLSLGGVLCERVPWVLLAFPPLLESNGISLPGR